MSVKIVTTEGRFISKEYTGNADKKAEAGRKNLRPRLSAELVGLAFDTPKTNTWKQFFALGNACDFFEVGGFEGDDVFQHVFGQIIF